MGYGSNCGMIGDMDPDPSYGGGGCVDGYSYSYSSVDDYEAPKPLYTFYSEEDLVTSAIFQKHLSMALAHKDKNIRELQNEILKYMETK